jgi:uncharacterized protein DUF4012
MDVAGERHRRFVLGSGVLAVLALWGLVAALSLYSARRDIQSGLDAVDTVRGRADATTVVDGTLLPELRQANKAFDRAHAKVGSLLLAPARLLPVVGRQIDSVSALSRAAATVASTAVNGITEAQPVLAQPGGTTAARASTTRQLGQVAGRADSRLATVRLGPREALLPPLARARNKLSGQLDELRSALQKTTTGSAAVADILTGPRRYLLFAANNAEMRAGSGMFLSAGELETGTEGIVLHDVTTVTEIPVAPGAVPLSGDLADRWGWLQPSVEWRNLMASPRFDASAPVAAEMWVATGHRPVDGVISLDPEALKGLLGATGPVEVDGRRVSADDVEEELLHGQYLRFSDDDVSERREELGKIARAVFAALDQGDWSVSRLASGLAAAAGGRHLMLWSRQQTEASAWQALGVDGALQDNSVLVSVLNRAGTKMDPFLSVAAEATVAVVAEQTEVTITLHLENRVPAGEPREVAGPYVSRLGDSGVGEGVYLGLLTVDVPGRAYDGRFDGVESLAVAGRDGPCQVMGFQVTLARGAQQTVVAHFRMPGTGGSLRVEPSARVPPIRWQSGATSWSDTAPRVLTWVA